MEENKLIIAINELTKAVNSLGLNDANTKLGGLELVAKEIKELKETLEYITNEDGLLENLTGEVTEIRRLFNNFIEIQ